MHRRGFLTSVGAIVAGSAALLAEQGESGEPAPKTARITSSVMVGILKGSMEEKLRKVAETGIQSMEMTNEFRNWSDSQADGYLKLAHSYGLGFDLITAQPDWAKQPNSMVNPQHQERFLKELEESIEWAKKYSVPQVLVVSGNEQPGMTADAQFAALVESGKRAADLGAANNIAVVLENLNNKVDHKGYFLTSAKEALRAVKEVDNPHFRLVFDIYHEYVQNGDPIPGIQQAIDYVNVFHVADAPGRHDPGSAQMKWDDIYKAIGKTKYAGYIAMEYRILGDEVASLIKAVTQMRSDINAAAPPVSRQA